MIFKFTFLQLFFVISISYVWGLIMAELCYKYLKKIKQKPDLSKTYITKVGKSFSGNGFPSGRIHYVPKEFIGKKVEVKLK